MIAVLAAAGVGLLSAFLPFTPAEPYLIGAVATTGASPVALGIAAGAGQTLGKLLLFLGARGVIRSPWLSHRPAPRKHHGRLSRAAARLLQVLDRPRPATGVLVISAVTGFPPLLATSIYLGRTPTRALVFAGTCLLGRTIRFTTIALAPHLVGY